MEMKKHIWNKPKIGSVFSMVGLFFIVIQGAYCCPIISLENLSAKNIFTGHTFIGLWSSQLTYTVLKKDILNAKLGIMSETPYSRWGKNVNPDWKVFNTFGSMFIGSSSKFLIYDSASLNNTGLERLLYHAPGVDLDYIKTFFSGIPHGKWNLEDIWINSMPPSAPVPEPSTMLILGTGLLGLAFLGKKKND
jgi:hypothetical protein